MTDYQIEDTAIGQAAITGRSLEELVNDIGEGKAKYWIAKGVQAALDEAILFAEIDLAADPDARTAALKNSIQILKASAKRLTAEAWGRRAQ